MSALDQFTSALQERMKEKLSSFEAATVELSKLGGVVLFLKTLAVELRSFVSSYRFSDEQEEIQFFKHHAPVILSQYYFHKKVFSIRIDGAFIQQHDRETLLIGALNETQGYINKNREFYEYCMSNRSDLDRYYFRRQSSSADPGATAIPSYEKKLSWFIAAELLRPFLLDGLHSSESSRLAALPNIKWTASKTDLTELIYALHSAGAFNDGTADLKQVATAFEYLFNVGLGDYYRTYQSIQVRKTNQLSFITKLKDRLQARLDSNL